MGEGVRSLAGSIGRSCSAAVAVCHEFCQGRWQSSTWAIPTFELLLEGWAPPLCPPTDEINQLLGQSRMISSPLLVGSAPLAESASDLAAQLKVGYFLVLRRDLICWLGFTASPSQERLLELIDLHDILTSRDVSCNKVCWEQLPAIYLCLNLPGKIIDCNTKIEQLGYRPEEVVGQEADLLFAPGEHERLRAQLDQVSQLSRFETTMRHRSGEYIGQDLMAAVVFDQHQQPRELVLLGRSLHQDRQQEHLRRIEAVSRLVSGVAHELNNPLLTVVGNAEMLTEMKLSGAARQRTKRVIAGARRCQEVVESLLRLQLKQRQVRQEVDLEGVIRRCIKWAREEFSTVKAVVNFKAAEGVPAIKGDTLDFEQALQHVLNNAFLAVTQRERPQIDISLDCTAQGLQILVEDNGPGMTREVMERAFEPFFTTRDVGAGKGLGLSIALSTVQAHGGQIELHASDSGTLVQIFLPSRIFSSAVDVPFGRVVPVRLP
jgi:PAS domain S-box-containing protein